MVTLNEILDAHFNKKMSLLDERFEEQSYTLCIYLDKIFQNPDSWSKYVIPCIRDDFRNSFNYVPTDQSSHLKTVFIFTGGIALFFYGISGGGTLPVMAGGWCIGKAAGRFFRAENQDTKKSKVIEEILESVNNEEFSKIVFSFKEKYRERVKFLLAEPLLSELIKKTIEEAKENILLNNNKTYLDALGAFYDKSLDVNDCISFIKTRLGNLDCDKNYVERALKKSIEDYDKALNSLKVFYKYLK